MTTFTCPHCSATIVDIGADYYGDKATESDWDRAGRQVDEWVARFRAERAARQVDADLRHGRGAFQTGGIVPSTLARMVNVNDVLVDNVNRYGILDGDQIVRPRLRSCSICGGIRPGCSTCNPDHAEYSPSE